jgi:hypothetical protein
MQENLQDDDQRRDTSNVTELLGAYNAGSGADEGTGDETTGGIADDGDDVIITEGGITDVTGTIPLGGSSDVGGTGNAAATADIGATTGAAGLDTVRTGSRAEAAAEQILSDNTTENGAG